MQVLKEINMRFKVYIIGIIITSTFIFELNLKGQTLIQQGVTSSKSASLPAGDSDTVRVKLGAILNVGITSAKSGGSVAIKNVPEIKSVGLCWATKKIPVFPDNNLPAKLDSGNFTCVLNNLDPGTLYFVRAYAITGKDTVYSKARAFYTHKPDAVADTDGNYYNSVTIGSQIWLAEDLKTTRLNDGSPIQRVLEDKAWPFIKTPAYCWYGNDSVNFSFPRGKLYNWYTVNTGKICPTGWHVPSDVEWTTLSDYLGGDSVAGGKLKTTGTIFWRSLNQQATNETGFSAIPGGYRNGTGVFLYSTIFDNWWSSDVIPHEGANYWYVYHYTGLIYHEMSYKMFGYSVRCLKN
jgi:uncharacterized protein (TIGR02145 family)